MTLADFFGSRKKLSIHLCSNCISCICKGVGPGDNSYITSCIKDHDNEFPALIEQCNDYEQTETSIEEEIANKGW